MGTESLVGQAVFMLSFHVTPQLAMSDFYYFELFNFNILCAKVKIEEVFRVQVF